MIFGSSPTMRNDRLVPSVHAILQSGNLYLFVMHNPVNFTDPSGLFAIPFCAVLQAAKKAAKKVSTWIQPRSAVQNTVQQASQTVKQTQQVSQAARGSVPAAQQAATPITRYAPQVTQQAAPRVQQVAPAAQQAVKQTVTRRDALLSSVQNSDLRNAVEQLYKRRAWVGDGGTADKLRHELQTGTALNHLQKAQNYIKNLEGILANQNLSPTDSQIALNLLSDLLDAVTRVVQ